MSFCHKSYTLYILQPALSLQFPKETTMSEVLEPSQPREGPKSIIILRLLLLVSFQNANVLTTVFLRNGDSSNVDHNFYS